MTKTARRVQTERKKEIRCQDRRAIIIIALVVLYGLAAYAFLSGEMTAGLFAAAFSVWIAATFVFSLIKNLRKVP